MKSYIVKLIQIYMDIISLNEDLSNNFDESIRQKQDELNQNQNNDVSNTDNDSDDILNNDYQNHLGMQSELDKIHKGQTFSKEELLQTNTPIIYAFITKYAPNAIKIGYTVQGAEQRVKQWQKYYSDAKLIDNLNYDDFIKTSLNGDQIYNIGAIAPIMEENILLNIRNTNKPYSEGTIIGQVKEPNKK